MWDRALATASTPSAVTRCSSTVYPAAVNCSTSARPEVSSRVPAITPSDTVSTLAMSGRCAVAKNGSQAAVFGVNVFRIGLGRDQ